MQTFLLSFLTVAGLQFLAMVAPGPDFAMVTKNAVLYPRRQAVYTALGIALGLSVHISYCILGLAVLISHSLLWFTVLKYAGAAYLVYIGIQACVAKLPGQQQVHVAVTKMPLSTCQAIWQGFLCNVLNPKASLFFLGLFAVVIKPSTPLWQQLTFGVWMSMVTFAWFALVAYFVTHPRIEKQIARIQPKVVKTLGVLLVVMGVSLLFVSHPM